MERPNGEGTERGPSDVTDQARGGGGIVGVMGGTLARGAAGGGVLVGRARIRYAGGMSSSAIRYEKTGRVARVTLARPERGNAITLEMPREIAAAVEDACLDPSVHVIALSGDGPGFCAGYDLSSAEAKHEVWAAPAGPSGPPPPGAPTDPRTIARNHDPSTTWDPMVDYAMMSRNVRGFMSLFHADKPVICKVHGFCVAGGTDMALCSDLVVIADDAKIGYPPARVWGVPTTALWVHRIGLERAKRLLFTGDSLSGVEAVSWGLASEHAPASELDARFEALLARVAAVPVNQLAMMKLLTNQVAHAQGLHATQILGTVFDGIARHTPEGYAFQARATAAGFKAAVVDRDAPFGDVGRSTFKGAPPEG